MNDNILHGTEFGHTAISSPNPLESFGVSDRYDFKKVLGQGAYGIVW